MGVGYRETLNRSVSADTAIVLRGGSASEVSSVLDHASTTVIEQAPGIARDAAGKPIASPELVVAANLPLNDGSGDEGSVQVRGIGDEAWTLRPEVKIIAGRKFAPGLRELVVGKGAQRQFAGLTPGRDIKLGSQAWTVAGVFESGNAMDWELWGDANVVADTYRRGSSRTSVFVRLTSPAAFDAFKAALAGDPRLQADTSTTLDYFRKQSEGVTKAITTIGIVVGVIMGIGAVFGALNTMFASVAARAREIATLRAIGFRGLPVVVVPLWKIWAGIWLYDLLAAFRNVRPHRFLGKRGLLQLEPMLKEKGLQGGARYYDAQCHDARLTLATARSAIRHGALVANYVTVDDLLKADGRVRGARVRDTITGATGTIQAHVVVNATGPWCDRLRRMEDPATPPLLRTTKGVHVMVRRQKLGHEAAITLTSPIDGRVMFVLPWGDFSYIGTTDTDTGEGPDEVRATPEDVVYLLRSANAQTPTC